MTLKVVWLYHKDIAFSYFRYCLRAHFSYDVRNVCNSYRKTKRSQEFMVALGLFSQQQKQRAIQARLSLYHRSINNCSGKGPRLVCLEARKDHTRFHIRKLSVLCAPFGGRWWRWRKRMQFPLQFPAPVCWKYRKIFRWGGMGQLSCRCVVHNDVQASMAASIWGTQVQRSLFRVLLGSGQSWPDGFPSHSRTSCSEKSEVTSNNIDWAFLDIYLCEEVPF